MNRSKVIVSILALTAIAGASVFSLRKADAQGRGAAAEARRAAQLALEEKTPQMKVKEEILPLSIPDHTIGETEGVSKNSKGHLFVYSRTGKGGSARGGTAAELFEFDQNNKFVKQWAPDNYAASFAHSVRVDKYDNVWMVDEGSDMIVKFNPQGVVKMTFGRKPEAIDYLEEFLERGEHIKPENRHPVGGIGTFNRETDVAWDSNDNIYVSDGYGNSRVVKITPDGKTWKVNGTFGSGPDQFNTPHGIAVDRNNNIYVADRQNQRVKVFDSDLNLKNTFTGMGQSWTVCATPSNPQYIMTGDGQTGKIYKFDLTGKLLGWAQTSLGQGESTCLIHEMHCESDKVIYKGACALWNIEKITIE